MGTIKALIGIVAIIAVVYTGWQVVPPELANYSFRDDLRSIAMMAGANPRQTDQDVTDAIVKKAQEHEIALAPEQITVKRIGSVGAPAVYVAVDYSVPVTLPGYSFTLHFTPDSGNKGF